MITFRNKGLVDLRAITTFGVNSKDTDTAIGQFGTGFKYAVAVALRLGAQISVTRGLETFRFTARTEKIRNDEFDLVYMNDQQLGFTTHLGHHWEPWQAFRELYCNMLDEGGEATNELLMPEEGYTNVYLDHPLFDAVWEQRHTVVLPPGRKPAYASDDIQIFCEPCNYLYYRGVRVAQLEKSAKHTFNILRRLDLTEDRTLQYEYQGRDVIATAIGKIEDKAMLRSLLFTGYDTYENTLYFQSWNTVSDAFNEVVSKGRAKEDLNPQALAYYRVKNPQVTLPKRVAKADRQEGRDLKSAIALCAVLGYDVKEYPVVITDELPDDTLGCVYPQHSDKIFLARRVFSQGVNMVAGTLLEEYLHLKYGLEDESRKMQNHLFDLVIRAAARLLAAQTASSAAPQ